MWHLDRPKLVCEAKRNKDVHRVLVEGDGVEALGLLKDDGGGGTQASLTWMKEKGKEKLVKKKKKKKKGSR